MRSLLISLSLFIFGKIWKRSLFKSLKIKTSFRLPVCSFEETQVNIFKFLIFFIRLFDNVSIWQFRRHNILITIGLILFKKKCLLVNCLLHGAGLSQCRFLFHFHCILSNEEYFKFSSNQTVLFYQLCAMQSNNLLSYLVTWQTTTNAIGFLSGNTILKCQFSILLIDRS